MDFCKTNYKSGLKIISWRQDRKATAGSRRAYKAATMESGEVSLRDAKASGLHPGCETRRNTNLFEQDPFAFFVKSGYLPVPFNRTRSGRLRPPVTVREFRVFSPDAGLSNASTPRAA